MLTKKRSTALQALDVIQTVTEKRRHGRRPEKRAIEPMVTFPEATDIEADDLNDSLLTLYPVRHHRQQPTPSTPCRTAPTRPTHINNIPEVTESLQSVNMDWHFPRLHPLSTDYSKDLQLKTHRDGPHQKVINKIVD